MNKHLNKYISYAVVFQILWALFLRLPSDSEAAGTETSRRVEEAKRQAADEASASLAPRPEDISFDSGLWANFRFFNHRNYDHDKSQEDLLTHSVWSDTRVWGRWTYQTGEMKKDKRRHFVFVRLKNIYVTRGGLAPGERFDNRGPLLDYGYTALDLNPWKIEAGRRYFNIGRGFVFSGVQDGVQINYQVPGWNIGAFASRSLPRADNIDTSVPGYDKYGRRYFSGLGIGYAGIRDHHLYGYAVVERDRSRERPEDPAQDYGYQAEYFALGAKGQWGKNWPYWVEAVRQTGHSREYPSNALSDISAWAVDAEQKYLTMTRSGLAWSLEYAAASGDPDRGSVNDTLYGNYSGRDTGFLYFGYIPTGIALSPLLSNLHMLRLGLDFYPFYAWRGWHKILLGLDYFRYWKNRAAGAVYDPDAAQVSHDVGQEIDVRLDWKPARHLALSLEWGYFIPGDAYWEATRTSEQVLSLSVSLTF